jgi:ABC-type polysaccharide/polyol phosphate export permease
MIIKKYIQKIKSIFGLSFAIAKAEFKLTNEGSYLGIFWYLLNPVIMFASLFAVFSNRLGSNIPYYALYLLLGIIMFNLFRNITTQASRVIIESFGIIKSINFPLESLVGQVIIKSLFSHFVEFLFFIAFLIMFKVSIIAALYYIIIVSFFSLFIFGFSLMLSCLSVYFIDMANIWIYGAGILWTLTPIFYNIGGQTKLFYFNLLNPVYYFITIARDLIIYSKMPELWLILGALFYAIAFFAIGILLFEKLKIKFAELI